MYCSQSQPDGPTDSERHNAEAAPGTETHTEESPGPCALSCPSGWGLVDHAMWMIRDLNLRKHGLDTKEMVC